SRERLEIADDLPPLRLGQLRLAGVGIDGAPRGHGCERDAVVDPVLELARRVLRYVNLKVERSRVECQRRRAIAESLWPVTHRAICLIESPARRDGRGIVWRGVLRETRGERHRRRRDVRRDGVRDAEGDNDQRTEKSSALREPLPVAAAAPPDQREETENRGAARERDRDQPE